MKSFHRSTPLSACLSLVMFLISMVIADDKCADPNWTGNLRRQTHNVIDPLSSQIVEARQLLVARDDILPGDINCRNPGHTDVVVNYYTCKRMSDFYGITTDKFFKLNPTLKKDCSNIMPNSVYCVDGFIEPVRAIDGLCGPKNNNATCVGQPMGSCCNSVTWKCGDTVDDCAPGTCYEGACPGDKVYSTDGTCGRQNGNRLCKGKWGECCNMNGLCGNDTQFCGATTCQMGNCAWPVVVNPALGNTTDGTCGGPKSLTCNPLFGVCCNKSGKCGGTSADCGDGCQPKFGKCTTTITTITTTKPAITTTTISTTSTTTTAPSTKETWKPLGLGCWGDNPTFLRNKSTTPAESQMTIEGCQSACKASKGTYAGLKAGKSCFCDTTTAIGASISFACDTPCSGNAAQTCGGTNSLNVYQYLTAQYSSVGCYVDAGVGKRTLRTFVNVYGGDGSTSVSTCADTCDSRGFAYSGTERGVECWCDSAIQSVAVLAPEGAAGCNKPCPGNATQICGGTMRMSVMKRIPF